MGKVKTSAKRKESSRKQKELRIKDFKGIKKVNPLNYLTNEENVGLAILECLQNNDPEGVMEAISVYVNALDKAKIREKGELSKSTFYHSLKNKNPTLKTLAKFVSSCLRDAA
jgi:DNA-binding phage protein